MGLRVRQPRDLTVGNPWSVAGTDAYESVPAIYGTLQCIGVGVK